MSYEVGPIARRVDLVIPKGKPWVYDFQIEVFDTIQDITNDVFVGAARLDGVDGSPQYPFVFTKKSSTVVSATIVTSSMPVGDDFQLFPYDWFWTSTLLGLVVPLYRGHIKLLRSFS